MFCIHMLFQSYFPIGFKLKKKKRVTLRITYLAYLDSLIHLHFVAPYYSLNMYTSANFRSFLHIFLLHFIFIQIYFTSLIFYESIFIFTKLLHFTKLCYQIRWRSQNKFKFLHLKHFWGKALKPRFYKFEELSLDICAR